MEKYPLDMNVDMYVSFQEAIFGCECIVCNAKQNERIAVQAVDQPLTHVETKILLHRQGIDIAGTTSVQVPRRRVVESVCLSPVVVGNKR